MAQIMFKPINVVKSYLKDLEQNLKINKAIVFGSAARNQMHRDSDIDLIILSSDFSQMNFIQRLTFLNSNRQGIARKVPMDILGYTQEEFDILSKESAVLAEAKEEGILISNF